jgi:hypothetical protein
MGTDAKMAAALAAVLAYIQSEEEMAVMQAAAAAPAPGAAAPPAVTMWSLSGRQSLMQMRHLMQLRTFHGAGLRR